MTAAMVRERRARVLATRWVAVWVVVRQVSVREHMHGRLDDLGHAGRDREQQHDGDQEPHSTRGSTG